MQLCPLVSREMFYKKIIHCFLTHFKSTNPITISCIVIRQQNIILVAFIKKCFCCLTWLPSIPVSEAY